MAGVIYLRHFLFGRNQPVEKIAVVGEQQQPLGGLVQPPHRLQVKAPPLLRQQFHDGFFRAVFRGGDIPRRFIQHGDHPALSAKHFPVQGDGAQRRVNFPGAVGLRLSVHGDTPGLQNGFYLAAGARAAAAQEFVQTFHSSSVLRPGWGT